jgi:hypothetical protein
VNSSKYVIPKNLGAKPVDYGKDYTSAYKNYAPEVGKKFDITASQAFRDYVMYMMLDGG